MASVSGPRIGATAISDMVRPAGWAGLTADTSGREARRVVRAWIDCELAGSPTTRSSGAVRFGGKSRFRMSFTWRADTVLGSTRASTEMNLTWVKNGIPSAINKAALAIAIGAGRRMTRRDRRYQKPLSAGRASRSAARASRFGASALTRGPRTASSAGSTVSARLAASSATSAPAMPIEYRKRCGKMTSEATAAAIVSELKVIVRPAVCRVR